MMKVLIFYFSGTGHTAKVANKFQQCFADCEDDAQTIRIEDAITPDGNLCDDVVTEVYSADLIGIGYPVHAFNAPSIVLDFAKALPKLSDKKRAFVFNTSGEPLRLNNVSSLKLRSLLKRRNYDITNEYRYCMPYNIIFRHSDSMAYRMWDTAEKLIPLDTAEIVNEKPHKLKRVFCGKFVAWVMRIEHWGGRFNGRRYKVNDKCALCQKCVKECPTHNIQVVNGKLKFGKKCLMCMRCAHLCPTDAIKIGLFNSWKVNGAYTFTQPQTEETQRLNRMLRKSYAKYFEEANARLAAVEKDTQLS